MTAGVRYGMGRTKTEGVHEREEARMMFQDILSLHIMWVNNEERSQHVLCCTCGHVSGGLDLEEQRVK